MYIVKVKNNITIRYSTYNSTVSGSSIYVYCKEIAMFGWFRKPHLSDSTEVIFLDNTGAFFYPLEYEDRAEFKESLDIIKEQLRLWVISDINYATNNGQSVENALSFQLSTLDLKMLPKSGNLLGLLQMLSDTEIDFSGTRLMDVIVRISMSVSIGVLETLKGRFLYGMVYTLPKKINDRELPTKDEWVELLAELPWVYLLPFIQEIYDNDELVHRIAKMAETTKNNNTHIANNPDRAL